MQKGSTLAIITELKSIASPDKAAIDQAFFQTGRGEYGQGDQFLGITMPELRKVAKSNFRHISLVNLGKLLLDNFHEVRMISLVMLVYKFESATEAERSKIYKIYLQNTKRINNWDLVDVTAPNIVGNYLLTKERSILFKLAKSKMLWERRIAIVATLSFIRNRDYGDTLKIATILLSDSHDLIHKAVGWMLREVGKRDQLALEIFLKKHYFKMPRTMLRYAIEKFPPAKRLAYLHGKV